MRQVQAKPGLLTDPAFYHPAFEEAYRYIIEDYPPPDREVCIFLPCSMQKPYSTSPSHRLFYSVIFRVFPAAAVHIVVFGTCGVVPAELERMYPFTHYRYMLGKCTDPRIKGDFQQIEQARLAGYLEKTKDMYQVRIAYCIGGFRRAMAAASERTGIEVLLVPSDETITRNSRDTMKFSEGSLSMQVYLDELQATLEKVAEGSGLTVPSP
jgi:archaeosine synthase